MADEDIFLEISESVWRGGKIHVSTVSRYRVVGYFCTIHMAIEIACGKLCPIIVEAWTQTCPTSDMS